MKDYTFLGPCAGTSMLHNSKKPSLRKLVLGTLVIYVRILPYHKPQHSNSNFLVTSVEIKQKDSFMEYWLTLMGDQTDQIDIHHISRCIQMLHKNGLFNVCQKIVSLFERKLSPVLLNKPYAEKPFTRKFKKNNRNRFNPNLN